MIGAEEVLLELDLTGNPVSGLGPARLTKSVTITMGMDGARMTQEQLDKMRGCVTHPKIDAKTVKVTCYDGDVLEGFIEFVSDEERDVILQLLSSNNPTKYRRGTSYLVRWDDIVDFQELK